MIRRVEAQDANLQNGTTPFFTPTAGEGLFVNDLSTATIEDFSQAMMGVQQAVLEVQEGVIKAQQASIGIQSDQIQLATIAIQQGAVNILKGALAIQRGGFYLNNYGSGLAPVNENDPFYQNNLGTSLAAQNNLPEAATAFQRAIELKPDYLEARKNLADTFLNMGEIEEAISVYKSALAVQPDYTEVGNNLAVAYLAKCDYEQAQATFQHILEREHGLSEEMAKKYTPSRNGGGATQAGDFFGSPFKLVDRIEQLSYLISNGIIDRSFEGLVERYQSLLQEIESDKNRVPYTPLTARQVKEFGGYFDKIIHYADAPRLSHSALNDSLDYQAIEEEYFENRALYFDDLLSPEALAGLRKFFLESTVFFRQSEAGFVGSYVNEGFNCSLIYQIIDELKERFPRVMRDRPLNNMWCYRYASKGSGVKPHNGDGSVTINFWFTPDDANLEPGAGGMVMYNKEHPAKWDWLKFNMYKDDPDIQAQVREYLADAKSFTIPYKCNRAVLFHSTLFHKTDPFHFRDGYENRRMNITMLFGRRGQESVSLK